MKVFVEIGEPAATAGRAELRDTVARLVDVGATGVSVSDHLFATEGVAVGANTRGPAVIR